MGAHDAAPSSSAPGDPPGDAPGDPPRATLEECVAALSSSNAEIRANAADALLDVPAGGAAPGERGAPWAFALVASGAIVPLLSLVQSVRRDGNDGLKPVECPENTPAVVTAGDTALLVLAECAAVAASLLAEEGWEVAYDEDADRPIFVDENSGMSQSTPPTLASTRGDWMAALLVETLTLVQPLSVHPRTGEPRWPVRVLRHVPARVDPDGAYHPSLSVLDVALEEGDDAERTRVLARGPWMGSDGDVEGERDPEEPPGTALDNWRDATVAAALALALGGKRYGSGAAGGAAPGTTPAPALPPAPPPPPRALALGLGCGSTASFLRARFPGVAVDAVEPDEETTRAARDLFSVVFDEERWSELTPAGRSARIARVPETVPGGRFRAWSGTALDAFLADDAARGAFDAVVGDFPIGATDQHLDDAFDAIARVVRPEGGVVAVAVRDPFAFRAACEAAARRFGETRVVAVVDPAQPAATGEEEEEDGEEDEDGEEPSAKRAKTTKTTAAFEAARGHAGVIIATTGTGPSASPAPGNPDAGGLGPGPVSDPGSDPDSDSDPAAFFAPDAWRDRVVRGLCAGPLAAGTVPYAVDVALRASEDPACRVWSVSYRAADDDDDDDDPSAAPGPSADADAATAAGLAAAASNANNAAWDMFGDGDAPASVAPAPAPAPDVGSRAYWASVMGEDAFRGPPRFGDATALVPDPSHADAIVRDGYVWGGVAVPAEETTALRAAVDRCADAGWPPACVFLSDLAWAVTDRLWSHAEAMLRGGAAGTPDEIVLEPSLAAFKLDPSADRAGRRYVGNNFGQPHRDYTHADVHGVDAAPDQPPGVLSVWLPLVDVTPNNGCMYVVPRAFDPDGGRGESAAETPAFDRSGVVALAPAPAGSLMAWAGNVVHWGAACRAKAAAGGETPRVSLAFVFRKRGARCDPRGPPLTREETRGSGFDARRRLDVVRHAVTCFEHWYGDTAEIRAKLTPREP